MPTAERVRKVRYEDFTLADLTAIRNLLRGDGYCNREREGDNAEKGCGLHAYSIGRAGREGVRRRAPGQLPYAWDAEPQGPER